MVIRRGAALGRVWAVVALAQLARVGSAAEPAPLGEPQVAVAVLSSDRRAQKLAPAILRTWARESSRVVIFVDSERGAQQLARGASAAPLEHVTVTPCCAGNSSLGQKLSTAQYKLEHTFAQMLALAPGAEYHVFTDDDTYWNMPLLRATIRAASGWVDASRPTALFPGRSAGLSPGFSFCQTSGPFMVMNRALVALLADRRVMDECRALTIQCYPVYRSHQKDSVAAGRPRLPLGDCPLETRFWPYPYAGALYNNDHLVNLCVARHFRRGTADALCLPGYEFDVDWAICGDGSPYYNPSEQSRRVQRCHKVCNATTGANLRTPQSEADKACPLSRLFEVHLDRLARARTPLTVHNQIGTPLGLLVNAMAHGESLAFAEAPVEPTRAQRVVDSIMAYHHARDTDMDYLHSHRTRGAPSAPARGAGAGWPRAWGARITAERWLRRRSLDYGHLLASDLGFSMNQ